MNVYLIKDDLSKQVVRLYFLENVETLKRELFNVIESLRLQKNDSAIRLLNDCIVYELNLVNEDYNEMRFGSSIAKRVLFVKDIIDIKNIIGSNDDKLESVK